MMMRSSMLCLLGALLFNVTAAEVFLGPFTTRDHDVAGDVYLLSDRALEIRNFVYDGTGPNAVFYMDPNPSPNRATGMVVADGSPSDNCHTTASNGERLPRATGVTQRVEIPDGKTIEDFLGGSLSVWCVQFGVNFGEVVIPSSIDVPTDEVALECFDEPQSDGVFLSSFTTRSHLVAGDLYLISDRVLEIRNYVYDGAGPAAYFWIDGSATPSPNGMVVSDGAPGNGCAMDIDDTRLPLANGITQRVELPPGASVSDYAGGSLSVWCERFNVNFGHAVIPTNLPAAPNDDDVLDCFDEDVLEPAPIATTPEGYNCEPLNEFYQVRWQIDGDDLNVELLGRISDGQYMGFGVSGLPTEKTFMIGADAVVADMTESGPRARDIYMDSRSQCANGIGVCPDTDGGFTNDVSDVTSEQDFGLTLIRYKRPLASTDIDAVTGNGESVDKSIPTQAGINTYIIWAIGPVSPGGFPLFHDFFSRDASLDFAREVADNCDPLAFAGGTEAPTASPPPAWRRPLVGDSTGDTTFNVHIGPSGGPRGYTAITGQPSWGIAWYVNDYLIPKLTLRRGTTYTFLASGGDDPSNDAKYHPFYLTDNPNGGYRQSTPAERLTETLIAGIDITLANETGVFGYEPTLVAPICQYETTLQTDDAELLDWETYFDTLDTSCASDQSIVGQAAELQFTPDETTPDTIYYHCVTHRDLGFEIEVIDEDAATVTESPTSAPLEEDFTEVVLSGLLAGSTLNYRVNLNDPAAGGADSITFVVEAPAVGWVGLAFSDNGGFMVGSEAVIGLPDTGEVQKYNLNSQSPDGVQPMAGSQQTLINARVEQTESTTMLTFTKIMEEPNEVAIVLGDNTFLMAWGSGNDLGFHARREAFNINLVSGSSEEAENPRNSSMWLAHGFLAAFAWGAFTPMAISASMVRKCMPEGLWFQIHRVFNLMTVAMTICAFAIAVAGINRDTPEGSEPVHFNADVFGGHKLIGLIIFILVFVQALNGLFRPHLPPAADEESGKAEKTSGRRAWEIGHRVFGLALLGLTWYQVHEGISAYYSIWSLGDDKPALIAFWVIAASILGFGILGMAATFNKK